MSAVPDSAVSQADIQATDAWFRALMPRPMRGWFTDGAPNEERARQAVDEMIRRSNARIAHLSEQVRTRQVAVDDWQGVLATETKRCHIAAVALARGGAANIRVGDVADDGTTE